MGTGIERIDRIGRTVFGGRKVAMQIAEYSRINQAFAHDLARELEAAASAAEAAMRELKHDPNVKVRNVGWRAWWVARHLREGRELCSGISAEMVKFNLQFRREFLENTGEQRQTSTSNYRGRVSL
ncbi:hypothetical protein GCM10009678_86410 [Actinomadura kijaniata]|uniref:Uncharacterized protein n=1 Tax=Actinomadura namibiensis TaxID=182080 RepID=A0A7W3M0T0_ACTNM|nr:hypothetical protein [Actinomadura namibiensis]MBA8957705.1 hypothetical protein [Actinomadura namibiensis]